VGRGPTRQQLAAFAGRPAIQPIRVYAGVDSAPTVTDRVRLVPWGDERVPGRAAEPPWPGRVPAPAPAIVHPEPLAAEVVDGAGAPVLVGGRGLPSAAPSNLRVGGGPWQAVAAWAGPWPVDERWWDPDAARRLVRLQVTTDEAARLLRLVDGRWWVEATYD